MAEEKVTIMGIPQYVKKYGVDGIGKGADRWMIKRQMLDNMRKEIFDMAVMMVGSSVFVDGYDPSDKEKKKLTNILDNANKKWRGICREFAKYKETKDLLDPDDLRKYLEDRNEFLQKKEGVEYVTEEEIEEDIPDETELEPMIANGGVKIEESGETSTEEGQENGSDETD